MASLDSEMERIGSDLYPTPPATFSKLVEALGGQNAARNLISVGTGRNRHKGVTVRTMERYAKAERGESGQTRPKGLERAKTQLENAWKALRWDKNRKAQRWRFRGIRVDWRGTFSTPSEDEEDRVIKVTIPPEEAQAIDDLWRDHNWEEAAKRFNYAVFTEYDLNGGVLKDKTVEDPGFWLKETDSLTLR